MAVSEVTVDDIISYCRIAEPTAEDKKFFSQALDISKQYIKDYTGLDDEDLDKHVDFVICIYVLCQDMYDNRALYVDKNNLNNTVESILGFHRVNLL